MKVAIVAPTPVPFTRGGAERAWAGLHNALIQAGHDAELVKLPVRELRLADLGPAYRSFAELDLTHFDAVISSKYPAWICPHPRHILWMFHPLRGLYDAYGHFGLPVAPGRVEPPVAELIRAIAVSPERAALRDVLDQLDATVAAVGADHPDLALPGPVSRMVVHWLDAVALSPREMSRHVALSRTVALRPGYLPAGVQPLVAHAPSDLGALAATPAAEVMARHGVVPDGYLFTASRLDSPKRIDLIIRAMAHVEADIPLLVGGTGPDEDRLRSMAAADPRIRLLGFVPDEDLPALYAGARAVPFVPFDEDYGLITVEAMAAGAPVVTTHDSGGPTEIVRAGVDGAITAPSPEALGAALDRLARQPDEARAMGSRARRRVARISWPSVIRTLLGEERPAAPPEPAADRPAPRRRRSAPDRPKVVVLTSFRVADRSHGGQLRAFHLYGALARHVDVEIVSLVDDERADEVELAPGLIETAVPRSAAHRAAGERESLVMGTPMTDVVAGSHIHLTPDHQRALRRAARDAAAVILAEPYLHPALGVAGVALPHIYDAYNVETDLKADVYPRTGHGPDALAQVRAVEVAAIQSAAAVTACSRADARRLAALGGRSPADTTVVPNGTDCSAWSPPSPERRAAAGERWIRRARRLRPELGPVVASAVFFGSWHPPNIDAAETILALAPERPEVVFVLAGRHTEALATGAVPGNVLLAGRVSDRVRTALLSSCHLAVNPMGFGSGTNLKILEYLAAGAPVVSTEVGVRGLEVVSGEHLTVVDHDGLSAAIAEVVRHPGPAAARAAAGRRLVEEHYDWPQLGALLAEVAGRITTTTAAGGPDEVASAASGAAAVVR